MNEHGVRTVLNKLQYRDWIFYLGDDNGRMYLQIHFWEQDLSQPIGLELVLQKGGKWMLSPYMVENEIVRTAYKAIKAAVEHEVDEQFKYENVAIYNPHVTIQALKEAVQKIEVRK